MEYQILHDSDVRTLMGLVSGAIAEGWRPQGGVGCSNYRGLTFTQAMVKD